VRQVLSTSARDALLIVGSLNSARRVRPSPVHSLSTKPRRGGCNAPEMMLSADATPVRPKLTDGYEIQPNDDSAQAQAVRERDHQQYRHPIVPAGVPGDEGHRDIGDRPHDDARMCPCRCRIERRHRTPHPAELLSADQGAGSAVSPPRDQGRRKGRQHAHRSAGAGPPRGGGRRSGADLRARCVVLPFETAVLLRRNAAPLRLLWVAGRTQFPQAPHS